MFECFFYFEEFCFDIFDLAVDESDFAENFFVFNNHVVINDKDSVSEEVVSSFKRSCSAA